LLRAAGKHEVIGTLPTNDKKPRLERQMVRSVSERGEGLHPRRFAPGADRDRKYLRVGRMCPWPPRTQAGRIAIRQGLARVNCSQNLDLETREGALFRFDERRIDSRHRYDERPAVL